MHMGINGSVEPILLNLLQMYLVFSFEALLVFSRPQVGSCYILETRCRLTAPNLEQPRRK